MSRQSVCPTSIAEVATVNFSGEGSASFSGQLRRSLRIPRPPRGRSLRSLHRGISNCMNPSPFETFPILSFISPTSISTVGRLCYCIVVVRWQPSCPASLWPLSAPLCPGGRAPCPCSPTAKPALLSPAQCPREQSPITLL